MSHHSPAQAELAQTACDQCHRCKLRCTRQLPHCQRCRRIGSACTFSTGKPIGKPRGSKNRASTTKAQASKGDEDQRYESQPVLSPVDEDEAWKSYQPLFQQRPTTADGNCAPTPSSSTNDFLTSDGSGQGQQKPDSRHHHHHTKSNSSPITTSSVSGSIRLDTNAMIPWPGSAGSEIGESLSLTDHMDMPDTSAAMELQSPFASDRPSYGAVEAADQLIIHETVSSATACLCDPTCLRVVESFQQAQLRPTDALLDRSLLLLRSGVTMCERSLTCSLCRQRSSTLTSLLLLQGAMRCYSALLASPTGSLDCGQNSSGVTIGSFEVDATLHGQVVVAVVKAEMRRGINVLMAFEKATQINKSSSRVLQAINHLSRALREEFAL